MDGWMIITFHVQTKSNMIGEYSKCCLLIFVKFDLVSPKNSSGVFQSKFLSKFPCLNCSDLKKSFY